jgi:hypothetical protein
LKGLVRDTDLIAIDLLQFWLTPPFQTERIVPGLVLPKG